MGKAKVSVSSVTKYRGSVTEEQASAVALKSAVSCVDPIVQNAKAEINKIIECEKNCKIAERTANEKLAALQSELSQLQSELASTPPTITVSEPCGTDEEGNTIYEDVEEPNPRYYALLDQIAMVSEKISTLNALKSELQDKIQQLSHAQHTYQEAINVLNNSKKEIISCCDIISKKSDSASSQLVKAIAAIQKYLGEQVHTEPVPSHTSISWSNPTSVHITVSEEVPFSEEISVRLKWKKIDADHDTFEDLGATNPNYNQGEEWQVNCQRCVPTFEMRKRGYNVTAMPKIASGDHLSYHPFDVWKSPNVQDTNGSGIDEIKQNMSRWGDGARAQVVVVWKGTNSGHTFIAEQRNGRTCFIDPQTNEVDVSYYFDDVRSGYTRFCRIDTLKPSKHIKDCCKER